MALFVPMLSGIMQMRISNPNPIPVSAGAYSHTGVKNSAEIEHILIPQPEADLLDRKQGGEQKLAGKIYFLLGMVVLHGSSGGFLKTGGHVLIA